MFRLVSYTAVISYDKICRNFLPNPIIVSLAYMIRYMNLRIFVDTFGHCHCRCNFTPGDLETPGIRTKD